MVAIFRNIRIYSPENRFRRTACVKGHWTLDVTFREDESRIRKDNGPEVFAMMRRLALGLIKHNKPKKMSLKKARFNALMSPAFASQLVFGIYVRLPCLAGHRLDLGLAFL